MAKAEIRQEGGKPTLYVDGKCTAPVLYALSDFPGAAANTAYAQKNIAAFAKAGVGIVAADTGLHIGWRKTTGFDPDALICELSSVLDANPDAKIFLRLHMNAPYWWMRDHPDECVIYRTEDGDVPGIDNGEPDRLIRDDHNLHMRVSLASEKWMDEACEKLELFLRALEGTPEGEALISVQVACGVFGEWHQWGWDVSEPMQKRFRKYLKETYQTEEALREAWGDPAVTFDTARYVPEAFRPGDEGCWRDPQKSQNVIDSQTVHQLVIPEAILRFSRTVKRISPERLCGAFYAYYLSTGGNLPNTMPQWGHFYPQMLHADPSVDFLSGPFCYDAGSRFSDGATIQRALLESHRLRGMLWLTEMDQRPIGLEYCMGGDPKFVEQTCADLRRCTLQPLMAGEGYWYYDHRLVPTQLRLQRGKLTAPTASLYRKVGWWETDTAMREIAAIQRTAQRITERDYKSEAEVLLAYDAVSLYYRAEEVMETVKLHHGLTRAGVIFDSIYLNELPVCDMQRYKCVIFVNCHMLSAEKRAECRRLTEGRLVIHLNGQGYCDGKTLSLKHLSETVGMKMEKTEASAISVGDEIIEVTEALKPLFKVCDEDAEVLARYDDGSAAAAILGNDVYIQLQYLPASMLKPLMQRAGVHLWCDSDEPVMAGAGLVAVNCQRAGTRTLTLPGGKTITVESDGFATPVYDIATGEQVM